jgi:hypothetical protein
MLRSPSIGAGEPEWVAYRSPSGFYSLEHPGDWKVERNRHIVSIIPDDQSGAVTISAYLGKPARGYPRQLITTAFDTQQPTSPVRNVIGPGWKGVSRTFLDKTLTPHRNLVVIVAANASGFVLITWNEVSPGVPEMAPVYRRVLESLQLSQLEH